MDSASNIWREIVGIEAELADPRCPTRKAKKARLEKLRREFLRTPYTRTWQRAVPGARPALGNPMPMETVSREEQRVPANCEAFTAEPDVALPLAGEHDPTAWVWPNAGCC